MRNTILALVLAAVGALVLWLVLAGELASPTALGARRASEPAIGADGEVVVVTPGPGRAEPRAPAAVAEPAPHDAVPAPVGATPVGATAHLVGRLVFPGGGGAPGVALRLRGWVANHERALKHGAPQDWPDVTGATDADGRFDLAFDPPPAFQFKLNAALPGYAELAWRWSALPPNATTDLGQHAIPVGGAVAGHVVRPDGEPTGHGWVVYAASSFRPRGDGGDETRVHAFSDPATGAFRLEGLPPGRAQLSATAQSADRIRGPAVRVRAGETAEAQLVYAGPALDRRLTLRASSRLSWPLEPDSESVACTRPDGTALPLSRAGSTTFVLDDLAPGSYALAIDDRRFLPWSHARAGPGDCVRAELEGNAAVALTVIDAATGETVEPYHLRGRLDGSSQTVELRAAGTPVPAGGVFRGLLPEPTTLIVEAEGYARCEVPLGTPLAHRTVEATAALDRGAAVRGLVTSGGTPRAGVRVELLSHRDDQDPRDPFRRFDSVEQQHTFHALARETVSAAGGGFAFETVPAGVYDVFARHGPLLASVRALALSPAATVEVELDLPAAGAIAGRCALPEGADWGADPSELELIAVGVQDEGAQLRFGVFGSAAEALARSTIAADGGYHLEPLAAGPTEVWLILPETESPAGFGMWQRSSGPQRELGLVEVLGGTTTRADFDLAPHLPGALVVDVRLGGEPAAGLGVTLVADDEGRTRSGGQVGPHGRVRIAPLFGGDWHLHLQPTEGAWSYDHPEPVTVEPGAETALRLDLPVARGSVRVVHAATGAPLAQRSVWIGPNHAHPTDADGEFELELLAGSYELRLAAPENPMLRGAPASLEWSPGGPLVETVALEPPPSADGE